VKFERHAELIEHAPVIDAARLGEKRPRGFRERALGVCAADQRRRGQLRDFRHTQQILGEAVLAAVRDIVNPAIRRRGDARGHASRDQIGDMNSIAGRGLSRDDGRFTAAQPFERQAPRTINSGHPQDAP
jgi:hypothetical protein